MIENLMGEVVVPKNQSKFNIVNQFGSLRKTSHRNFGLSQTTNRLFSTSSDDHGYFFQSLLLIFHDGIPFLELIFLSHNQQHTSSINNFFGK
jgi:hypothetical protein